MVSNEPATVPLWAGRGGAGCYPDCDTTTGPRVLDIFDFLCFQSAFSAGCP